MLAGVVGVEPGERRPPDGVGIALGRCGAGRFDGAAQDVGPDLPRGCGDLPLVDAAEPVLVEHTLEGGVELVSLELGQ